MPDMAIAQGPDVDPLSLCWYGTVVRVFMIVMLSSEVDLDVMGVNLIMVRGLPIFSRQI